MEEVKTSTELYAKIQAVKKYNRNKVKYTCPDCGAKVWGKLGLHIECSNCACSFEEEEHENTDEN